jgi:hypothetical protein
LNPDIDPLENDSGGAIDYYYYYIFIAKVNAALNALDLDLDEKYNSLVTVGGYHALVQLVKDCLEKATKKFRSVIDSPS